MQKLIGKILLFIILLFFIEIAGAAFFWMYIDYADIQKETFNYLVIAVGTLILIDLLVVIICFEIVSNRKAKSDVSSLAILGSDIEEAYQFGKIGLVIVDEDNIVIWTNNFFNNVKNNIIDKDIINWDPYLDNLIKGNEKTIIIEKENKWYEVEYIEEARLFIFRDISEQEVFRKWRLEKQIAIGFIEIDNSQNITNSDDEFASNDFLNVQKKVADYAKQFHLMLVRIKTNKFMFIGYKNDCTEAINDKFSIIEEVKRNNGEFSGYTISIGVGMGLDDFDQLYDLANQSLNVSLGRGGDQAVISAYNQPLKYIGGRTNTKETRSLVQVTVYSSSLSLLIKQSSSVYIMGHTVADFDAIGASFGAYAFALATNPNVKIIYDSEQVEPQTRKAIEGYLTKEELAKYTIDPEEALKDINSSTLLILVDVHNPDRTMSAELCSKVERVVVIDHHRLSEKCIERPVLNYIEPKSSSASEMITEMSQLSNYRIRFDERIATLLFAGILLDTNSFHTKTTARTYAVSSYLKDSGANSKMANDFLKVDYNDYIFAAKILNQYDSPAEGIVVATVDESEHVSQVDLSKVASAGVNLSGINACFVVGSIGDKITSISSRSDGTVNCQIVMEQLGGGGSYSAAAALFKDEKYLSVSEVKGRLIHIIESSIEEIRDGNGE